jgi:hypothetical protein
VPIALSFLLLWPLLTTVQAQTPRIDRIVIADPGLYERTVKSRIVDPNSPSGSRAIVESKLVTSTTTIPARLGTTFGFSYTLVGQPAGAETTLKIVSHFPSPGVHNSTTNQMQLSYEQSVSREIGAENYTGWTFTELSDLIAGTWTIEIWYDGRKMAEQKFTTTIP